MTQLPRAATADELVKLRSGNQSYRMYLTAHLPATVYTARLAAVPASTDSVTSITYNTGSGTYTNILADMTLLVGTSAGASDLGMARIRNTTGIGATSGTFNIGEESEIPWAAGAYLTVLDEFLIWPRHITLNGTTPYIDLITYTDENSKCDPVPVMGPPRVAWLNGSTVDVAFDASNSWSIGNTIMGYSWAAPGASATSGLSTATPTITYNAAGTYRVACTVTNSDGKSFTGYRYVFIVTSSSGITTQCTLDALQGSQAEGGWTAQITLYDEALLTQIRDRALMILHTRDWYGDSEGSIGFAAGAENILFVGWLNGQSLTRRPEGLAGRVSMTIEGPQAWLNRIPAFPVGLKDRDTTPTKWTRWWGLNIQDTVWHLLRWRSTATRCMDVYPLDNTWRAARIEAPGAQTLWTQLATMESTTVKAMPCCDRWGRLFNQVEQQLLTTAQRASVPTVMEITSQDWSGEIQIERRALPSTALVDWRGVSFDGTNPAPYASLSPGKVYRQYGQVEAVDRLVLYDQAGSNTLCGLYAGWKNNKWPRFTLSLAAQHRLIDIAPYQYFTFNLAAGDTPRGTAFSGKIFPRLLKFEPKAGTLLVGGDFEAESFAEMAVTNVLPELVTVTTPPDVPILPPVKPPTIGADAKEVWLATTLGIYWAGDFFNGGEPTWNAVAALPTGLSSIYRFATAYAGSHIYLIGTVSGVVGLWKCANPKAVSPTWTKVIAVGDSFMGGIASAGWGFAALVPHGTTVSTIITATHGANPSHRYHYEYNGTAATVTDLGNNSNQENMMCGYRCYDNVLVSPRKLYTTAGVEIGTYSHLNGQATSIWQNLIGGHYYGVQAASIGGSPKWVVDVSAGTIVSPVGATGSPFMTYGQVGPRGAWNGTEVNWVDVSGNYYQLLDGATAVLKYTWLDGVIEQSKLLGGGALVWAAKTLNVSSEMIRISLDMGANWPKMNGNLAALLVTNETLINLQLVF